MDIITTRQQLLDLARKLGVRSDWHEPDEQGLTARLDGFIFDNAGFWPTADAVTAQARMGLGFVDVRRVEQHVVITRTVSDDDGCGECGHVASDTEDVAAINLATLLAWACGYER